ncbi:hypothetical protein B0T17DRAFT_621328 [Bombardia bombarda]|uniref:Uncharacterized protein n=1 Tax=Bombardia bombarda TaxID=252184 RepID=A0AA39U0V1_9PEZI|nr:hypothetical protein B0T17DRAFT_621328 [Bombardia bombarda]
MIPKPTSLALGLLLSLLATPSPATAIPTITATYTTTDWIDLPMALPHPYESPSLSLATSGKTTAAILALFSSNPCGARTEFASTTTVALPVDCKGASTLLSVSVRRGGCPMGGTGLPAIVDTVTATPSTAFAFTCAPTPAAPAGTHSSSYLISDITHTLPLPTLRSNQKPSQTPTALSAVHYPDGECRVWLGLQPTGGTDRAEQIAQGCSDRFLRPTTYAATATSTIGVDCDGCAYIRGGNMQYTCARSYSSLVPLSSTTVAVATATTQWVYDCLPRT